MGRVPAVSDTRYARTADGAHIAYEVTGDGPVDIVEVSSGLVSVSIDSADSQPDLRRYYDRLAGFARLIRFDARGVGMSDPLPSHSGLTIEERLADVLAVLDAAGARQPAVMTVTAGAMIAVLLAATHPGRVRALVLIHPVARTLSAPDYPWGMPAETFDERLNNQFEPGRTDDQDGNRFNPSVVNPSKASDEVFRAWSDSAGRRGASPATAKKQFAMLRGLDVRSVLPTITTPTLVLQRRDNAFVVPGHSRYVADHIPGARYVELSGADTIPWIGDPDGVLDEIEEFLTGSRPLPEPNRLLATVLFSDIVDSTAHDSLLGDRAWHERLDAHDAMVRRQLGRFGGREIKTTGDGFLAIFDSPARSINCGRAICDGARQLGIEVRVGLHTGEIELHGDDIRGMTVNIAARVAAKTEAGRVMVSRTVTDLVAGSGIEFSDRGEHDLKGVRGAWRLFAVED